MKKKLVFLTALFTLSTHVSRARRKNQVLRSALTRDFILRYGSLQEIPHNSDDLVISDTVTPRKKKFIIKEHGRIIKHNAAEKIADKLFPNQEVLTDVR